MDEPIIYYLKLAAGYMNQAIKEIDNAPNITAIPDLINACLVIDALYKEFCKEVEEYNEQEPGSLYENDPNLEFEIDSCYWHDVSLALRKLVDGGK